MKTLYHYCSTSSFHSIVTNKSIWLSSLSLSNDSKEGKLVSEILLKLAKDDDLKEFDVNQLIDKFDNLSSFIDGLGFCLSEKGDLLSQWRGYANDGSGVSIGFSKEYLASLSKEANSHKENPRLFLQKVVYDNKSQVKLIHPTYVKIKEFIDEGVFRFPAHRYLLGMRSAEEIERETEKTKRLFSQLSITVFSLLSKIYLLKAKAFREEHEWRLISPLVEVSEDPCLYRASNDRIIPYREYKLLMLKENAITEIYLGPKNITPKNVIKGFLTKYGFENTKILRSEATYR